VASGETTRVEKGQPRLPGARTSVRPSAPLESCTKRKRKGEAGGKRSGSRSGSRLGLRLEPTRRICGSCKSCGRSVSIHHFKEMINCFESPGGNSMSGATKPLDPREARGAHRSRGACFRGAEPGLMAQSSPRRIAGHRACASSDWGGTHPLPVAPTPPAGPRRHADGSLPAASRLVRKHWTG